jgi:hypothetical protein
MLSQNCSRTVARLYGYHIRVFLVKSLSIVTIVDDELSRGRVKNCLFSMLSRPALGPTQPPIQWVPGALSPGLMRPGREAVHLTPTSAEVKKMWMYTFTPDTPCTGTTLSLTQYDYAVVFMREACI